MGFTALDYAVLVAYLAASAAFAMWVGRGQKDLQGYFLGGRQMSWWAICISIVATETSTLTFIGAPAISYAGNMTFLQVALGYCLGKILVSLVLMPGYLRGHLETAYELLNHRFGSRVRTASALLFQVTRALSDGVRLFATALVLTVVTQISDNWTVIIIGAVTVAYTLYGGMRAVVWSDVIHFFVYIAGALLAFWVLLRDIPGGWAEVAVVAGGKLQALDFEIAFDRPYTFLGGLVGGAFLTFATHGTDHMMVQRYLTCGSLSGSRKALVASGVVVFFQFLLFLLIGVMLFAFYQHFPIQQELPQTDRIFPIFIVEQMPPLISGLIIAAIFAAAMSTLSSSLNSLASSTVHDLYRPFVAPRASERHYLGVSRWLTLIWGVVLVAISFLAKGWGSVLQTGLTIASITMGSVLGIFLLGLLIRRPSQTAGLIGMLAGLLVMLSVSAWTPIAWTWYVLIGTTATLAVGLIGELAARIPSPERISRKDAKTQSPEK